MSQVKMYKIVPEKDKFIYALKVENTIQPLFDNNGYKSGIVLDIPENLTKKEFESFIQTNFEKTKTKKFKSKIVHFTNGSSKNEDHSLPFKFFIGMEEDEKHYIKRIKNEDNTADVLDSLILDLPGDLVVNEVSTFLSRIDIMSLMLSNKKLFGLFSPYYLKYFYIDIWRFFRYSVNNKKIVREFVTTTEINGVNISIFDVENIRLSIPPESVLPRSIINTNQVFHRDYGLETFTLMKKLKSVRISQSRPKNSGETFLTELHELYINGKFDKEKITELHFDDSIEEKITIFDKQKEIYYLPSKLQKLVLPITYDTDYEIATESKEDKPLLPETLVHLVLGDRESIEPESDIYFSIEFDWVNWLPNLKIFECYRTMDFDQDLQHFEEDYDDEYTSDFEFKDSIEKLAINYRSPQCLRLDKNYKLRRLTLIVNNMPTQIDVQSLPYFLKYLDIDAPRGYITGDSATRWGKVETIKFNIATIDENEFASFPDELKTLHIRAYPEKLLDFHDLPENIEEFVFESHTVRKDTGLFRMKKLKILKLDYFWGSFNEDYDDIDVERIISYPEIFPPFITSRFPDTLIELFVRIGFEKDTDEYVITQLPPSLVKLTIYGRPDKESKLSLPELPDSLKYLEIGPNVSLQTPVLINHGMSFINK